MQITIERPIVFQSTRTVPGLIFLMIWAASLHQKEENGEGNAHYAQLLKVMLNWVSSTTVPP